MGWNLFNKLTWLAVFADLIPSFQVFFLFTLEKSTMSTLLKYSPWHKIIA